MLDNDRKDFYSYDSSLERTYYDEQTGGFLVTQLARKYKPKSKNENEIFMKEQRMGMKLASFGFQIEHLNEVTGVSSPDVRVRRHGSVCIIVHGVFADFKSTKSANNIVDYAKHAVRDQRADFIFIEFESHDRKIPARIKEMIMNNIHGYYYYRHEKEYYSF